MTPEQVKQKFRDEGQTVSEWARKNGFTPHAVYRLLNGYEQGLRGKSHHIAVKLGLKAKPTSRTN